MIRYEWMAHFFWQAACLNCAGTTAWRALDMPQTRGTALLQGMGFASRDVPIDRKLTSTTKERVA